MLTLPETVKAIKALDTAPDIISQACEKVLKTDEENENEGFTDTEVLAKDLMLKASKGHKNHETIEALTKALAWTTAIAAKSGREIECLRNLQNLLTQEFMFFIKHKLEMKMEENPAEAIEEILH